MKTTKGGIITQSATETEQYAASLAPDLRGKIILLKGNLGAGKTTFVRGFAKGLGINTRITSPTFTYQRIHGTGRNKLYHFDCYRAGTVAHLLQHDLAEALADKEATVLIEWPYRLSTRFPSNSLSIEFKLLDESKRRIRMKMLYD